MDNRWQRMDKSGAWPYKVITAIASRCNMCTPFALIQRQANVCACDPSQCAPHLKYKGHETLGWQSACGYKKQRNDEKLHILHLATRISHHLHIWRKRSIFDFTSASCMCNKKKYPWWLHQDIHVLSSHASSKMKNLKTTIAQIISSTNNKMVWEERRG